MSFLHDMVTAIADTLPASLAANLIVDRFKVKAARDLC